MNKMLEKRSVQVVLGIVVIVVWGFNMSRIADISGRSEQLNRTDKINLSDALLTLPELREYQYSGDFRDPFEIQLNNRPQKKQGDKPKPKSKPKKIKLPKLSLTGVIEQTALLKNNRQTVFFATVGDTVEGARIQAVSPDSVVLVFKTKEFTIKL